jgi:hypothetical protein
MHNDLLQGLRNPMRRLTGVAIVELLAPSRKQIRPILRRHVGIGDIITVTAEGVHGVDGLAFGLGQK